jgi:PAS domain S-box-containing protein
LSVSIAIAGYRYHRIQNTSLTIALKESLGGIASSKAQAVEQWQLRHIADGRIAMRQSQSYAASWTGLASEKAHFSPAARAWIDSFVSGENQEAIVLTAGGQCVYPTRRAASEFSTEVQDAAAVRTSQPAVSELHTSVGKQDLHVDLVIPVFGRGKTATGVIVLYNKIDQGLGLLVRPSSFITPSLQTALVRRDAGKTLYLGFRSEGKPTLSSISRKESSADPTLEGEEGEYEAVDYRGRQVLAATVAIPGTRWWLLAKVDADDLRRQAAIRQRSSLLFVGLLSAITALGAAFAWRTGTASLYRELYGAEVRGRALSGHYGYLSRYSNDLIFLSDRNGVIIEANERCESVLVLTRKYLIGRQLRTMVSESGLASFDEGWANAARQDGVIFESELLPHGRGPLPVEISARALSVDGREFVQAIARDITERKRGEEDWRGILRTTTDAFCAVDALGRLVEVNDKFVEMAGIPEEQLAGLSIIDPNPFLGLADFQWHIVNLRKKGGDRWETWYRRPDGRTYYLDVSAQYLKASGRGFAFIRDMTAAKQAMRDLEQSQRMIGRVVRIMPDLLYIFELRRQRYSFVNRAFEEFFGWGTSGAAAAGSKIPARLIHPDDLARIVANYQALARAPESSVSQIEFRVRRVDGAWRHLRAREVVFSRTEEGQISEVLGIAEDITEKVEAAEQVRHANALLSATFNASPLALVIHDLAGRVLRWNPAAEEMFGWREQEVLGLPVPFSREEELRLRIAEVVAGNNYQGVDLRRRRKDGSTLDVSIWTAPIRGSSGEVTAIVGVVMDITEQKRARAELEKSRASLLRAHRMASLGSWTADLVSGVADWSDETHCIFGFERGRVTPGWDAYIAIVHPEDRAAVEPMRDPPLEGVQPYRWEHRIVRPDGTIRHVRQSAVLVADHPGKPVQLAGTVQDVTEYKVLEEQLWQAQKLETVGRLAGGIAHDFNNLLTVINGYGELLLHQSSGDPMMEKGLSEILGAGERAAELTKNLLTFSRKQVVEIKPVDLNATVSGMQTMLSRLIGDDVSLELDLWPDAVPVIGDPVQLQQVLLNLAVNARDAMPNGGTLRIATALLGPSGEWPQPALACPDQVLLSVSDTGTGISDEVRSHLFEPFFTTKEPGKGTGLGLSTVYGIVTAGGGAIAVDTAAGRGTTFRILFPLAQLRPAATRAVETQVPHRAGGTILVAEDQDDVRRLLVTMLTELGYRVIATRDGESALREFGTSGERIDTLISDVLMPGMSGFELAQTLKAMRPGLPVLFISGFAPEANSAEARREGGSGFLAKPFTREMLAQKLAEVLRQVAGTAIAS